MKRTGVLIYTVFILGSLSFSQENVKGRIIDELSGNPVAYVNISITDSSIGTSSSLNGEFTFKLKAGKHDLVFSAVGYARKILSVKISEDRLQDMGNIILSPNIIGLHEINIISSLAQDRHTPVALSTIPSRKIENELGDQPLPEVMKMVPGVYASRTGGGSGDAAINIRGFKQENVALLLNGIPIGSVENGLVYWNNWLGLSDATQQIQIQRGLGASKVALNSVGGTVNIITKTTEAPKGGAIRYSITDYGNSKFTLSYNTGKQKNGMAISFLGSRIWGPGFVDATYVRGWGYFLSVSKEFNHKHKLVFVGLGNPERHGQRNIMLSKSEVDRYGLKFNKDWGSYNGEVNNASENFYHKPHLSLNHYWDISDKSFLATSVYFSYGYGGGKWSDSFMTDKQIYDYRNPSGQIDWGTIYENNFNNNEYYVLSSGDSVTGYSRNIQTNFLASHIWTGLISTFEQKVGDNTKITAGVHYRYFKSKLQQKVRDLLGGDFYIDNYAWAIDGPGNRNEIKQVGDIIKVNNGAIINFVSLFAQAEYTYKNINAFLSGSISTNWYQRYDKYNYLENTKSETINISGYDFKGGLNYNLNEYHNLFFNSGYFSRVPYYKFVFANYSNEPSGNLENELITSGELGYGYNRHTTTIKLNGYYTYWKDRSLLANEYNQFLFPVMIKGLDARHQGIELEISQGITSDFKIAGSVSLGDWKWKNNVSAEVYDNNNVLKDTVKIYADGLFVGDSPQAQYRLFGQLHFLKIFDLVVNWVYYDKLFADFDPVARNNPKDNQQSFKIPSYYLVDIHLSTSFSIGSLPAIVNLSCFNVMNRTHILRGMDGPGHDIESFRGFWGFSRSFSIGITLKF